MTLFDTRYMLTDPVDLELHSEFVYARSRDTVQNTLEGIHQEHIILLSAADVSDMEVESEYTTS